MTKLASFAALASVLALSTLVIPACSSESADKEEVADETSQELTLGQMRIAGSLAYGETSKVTPYTRVPRRYVAYKFAGNAGDQIDVWVRSNNGDPVTWILDDDFHVVAKNDDASPSNTDSHVTATLPAHPSATHYIVVRDYWLDPMTFRVSLAGTPADPAAGCNVDADCAKVEKGCCPLGNYVAVRADKADAYRASLGCQEPQICPKIAIRMDYSMPQCNVGTHRCELVKPADIACLGFTTNPHQCPEGYKCKLPVGVADVPGKCVQFCGGIAAFPCRDENEECVDDPTDDCDPAAGGADCGGICQPKAAPPPPPPPPANCNQTGCPNGQYCSLCWGSWACIPNGAMC